MPSNTSILVLGAGELGISVLQALSSHPRIINNNKTPISVLLRSTSPTNPSKQDQLSILYSLKIAIITADIVSSSVSDLTLIFQSHDTIISCTGFAAPPGTQLKITQAVLNARVRRYIPWQFGLDYDAIGRGSGQDLFDEQLDVRDLLRGNENPETEWIIVSTGLFMSFLFKPVFVVDLQRRKVTALGSWDNAVTVTGVADIGAITAEAVLAEPTVKNEVVYTAGETITYGRLAEVVEESLGGPVERKLLTVPMLKDVLDKNPGDGMAKYRLVFAKGIGASWEVAKTWNQQRGMQTLRIDKYIRNKPME
jgi:NmrA-like family